MSKRLYLGLFSLLLCAGLLLSLNRPASAKGMQLTPTQSINWSNYLGVNAHFLWFSPNQYRKQIQQLKALGLDWVRVDLHWDRHEEQEGRYRLAELDELMKTLEQERLKSVFYLVGSAPHATSAPQGAANADQYPPKDPLLYAKALTLLAQRYPQVSAWQVWNEPNLPAYWRPHEDPEGYGKLLYLSTQALRQVAPDKPVVAAGMAYYSQMPVKGGLMFEELGKLGVQQLGTVLAYHPYSQEPEGDEPSANDFIMRARQLNASLRSVKVPQIWATEWGWSSYLGPKELQEIIGPQGQADYLLRRLALMSALDFDRIFIFALSDLDDRASARDQHYGLLDLKGDPKPAYLALARFLKVSGTKLSPGSAPELAEPVDDLYSVAWRRSDGKNLWLFWSASAAPLTLNRLTSAQLIDPLTGQTQDLSGAQSLQLKAKPSLQMLVW